SNRPVRAAEVLGRAESVAAPADRLRMRRPDWHLGHATTLGPAPEIVVDRAQRPPRGKAHTARSLRAAATEVRDESRHSSAVAGVHHRDAGGAGLRGGAAPGGSDSPGPP